MKSKKKIKIFLQAVLFLLAIVILPARSQDKVGSAVETVKAFYKLHFARGDRMYFEPQNIHRKRKWFTNRLYKLMLYEFQRARDYESAHPEYAPIKPYFDGDVFTDCQSPADAFLVTRGMEKGDKAEVTVWAYWNNDTVGKMKRKINVVLLKVGDKWLIDNLIYEEGENFVDQLRRPSYHTSLDK